VVPSFFLVLRNLSLPTFPTMEFTPEDVKRLYGTRLYLLPDDAEAALLLVDPGEPETSVASAPEPTAKPEAPATPDPAIFAIGRAIDWKMKANANLALVLTASEFANRALTALLKQAVLDAGVNVARIGFGIYEAEADSWDFGSMPVSVAVVCGACAGKLSQPLAVKDKQLFPAPFLAEAARHPDQQAQLAVVLRQARAQLG